MPHVVRARPGFSLIELVLVVVIISIISAIALPRMSQAATSSKDASVAQCLLVLRKAIDLYAAEHQGVYPASDSFKKQLLKYTDERGNVSNQMVSPYIYGPYLSAISVLPVGPGGGQVGSASGSGVGWIYEPVTGSIRANTTVETDARGVLYSTY